jgi:hypothetical protein
MARPFDAAKLTFEGTPTLVASRVAEGTVSSNRLYSVSNNGVVAFVSGAKPPVQLTWVTRAGQVVRTVGAPAEYNRISLSADDTRVLAERAHPQTGRGEVWSIDLVNGGESRLASSQKGPSNDLFGLPTEPGSRTRPTGPIG